MYAKTKKTSDFLFKSVDFSAHCEFIAGTIETNGKSPNFRNSLKKARRHGFSRHEFAAGAVQQRDCWESWSFFEFFVLKGDSPILSVQREAQRSFEHIQANSQNPAGFELFPVRCAQRVAVVTQLAHSVVRVAELVVAEGRVYVESFVESHADLQLVIRERIRVDFPVVYALNETLW